MKKPFPLSRVYGHLEPGPVVLITTAHQGRVNIMTMSWHTMMDFEPPLVGCVQVPKLENVKKIMAGFSSQPTSAFLESSQMPYMGYYPLSLILKKPKCVF
jgi:hypothetical protein